MDSEQCSGVGDIGTIVPQLNISVSSDADSGVTYSKPATQRRQLSSQELEALKPVIKDLYIDQGLPFRELRNILSTQYDYNPTVRQFARLRKKWGLNKNTKSADRHEFLQYVDRGEISEEGWTGTVSLNIEKVQRWRREMSVQSKLRKTTTGSKSLVTSLPMTKDQLFQLSVGNSQLTRQPMAPAKFLITEGLLYNIDTYVAGMYDQKAWRPVEHGTVQDVSSAAQLKTLDKFYSGCDTAYEFIRANKFVEARKVLSAACGLVREIIASGHPETLNYLLDTFHDLTQERSEPFRKTLNLLRDYIGRMAMIVLPKTHPWRAICCSLGQIDINELDQTVVLSMKTLADVSGRKGGRFSSSSVWSRVMYIQWTHANDLGGGEAALRKLLAEIQSASPSHPEIFVVMKYLSASVRRQGRLDEYEDIGKEYIAAAQSFGTASNLVVGYLLTAMAQYMLGKESQAEANQREAIQIRLSQADAQRMTWGIRHLGTLEAWYREWGRVADAEKIKSEMESLIERETAGEEDLINL